MTGTGAKVGPPAPGISVLMDVSDGDAFLDEALASLTAQTFADFEIVLCAHGTTPETAAIIEAWERCEPRLRVIWCERLPLARAHMQAARAARAGLLARLDADDIALPDRLERQHAMFAADPALGFAGSAVEIIDRDGRLLSEVRNPLTHKAIAEALRHCCPIVHSSLMMRTGAFWTAGGYREGLNVSEDYDLCARMIETSRAANLVEPLVRYRVHSDSITSRNTARMAIAGQVVQAAIKARRRALAEPFVDGTPSLRRAQGLLGLTRRGIVREVRTIAWQSRASRKIITGRLPFMLNGWLRNTAIALGLRPAYSLIFRMRALLAEGSDSWRRKARRR